MAQEEYIKNLKKRLENKQPLKIDLKNGVILDLTFDNEIQAYRGYWKEEDMYIGIWTTKTFSMILNGEIKDVKILLQ